jgi:hypothetical protein
MGAMETVERRQLAERPAMKAGDTVRVHVKVREGDKERIQVFEGIDRCNAAARARRSREALFGQGASGSSHSTRRSSIGSRWCGPLASGARSCTTCAISRARPRG